MRPRHLFVAALLFVICVLPLGMLTSIPAPRADYVLEQAVPARSHVQGELVHIAAVRSFRYRLDGSAVPRYVDRSYDLSRLRRVWFGLSPFGAWRGPAHAFVSFEFADSQFVSISVEARKQVGEVYTPVGGLLRRYELMFVIAEEADLISLRTDVWGDPVYLYPGRATPAQAGRLFLALLERAESVRRSPEYYHTLTNNCATNLADAVNEVTPVRISWHHSLLLPGYSDSFAYEQGLLAIAGPPDALRQAYLVNDSARAARGSSAFSQRIRNGRPPAPPATGFQG